MSNKISQSLLDSMQNLLVLLDKNFLKELDEWNEKELFIRIISLDFAENPRSEIQGYTTGGSINVDGSSAVRRTCNLTMVTSDTRINQTDWALESKFKLEIGLRNFINPEYPDIIWFPQGIYILTSFSSSVNAQGFTISLQGKDKMCLLDGSVGGNLFATHDFGKLEIKHDDGSIEFEPILIYDIIRNAIHEYALEPYENIIINDLEDCSVELLNYMAKNKQMIVYETREVDAKDGYYIGNIAFEGSSIYNKIFEGYCVEKGLNIEPKDYHTIDIVPGFSIQYQTKEKKYEVKLVKQVNYGDTVGYRLTDLTYAGDLILNAGSTITQLLDTIVNMLGEFEYFYDLDGRFIFQRKKIYYNISWTNAVTHEKETYYDSVENGSENAYSFVKGILIESYNNKPDLNNIKNDYTIWGQKTTGNENYPIHIRCAIDDKPLYYKPLINGYGQTWGTSNEEIVDESGNAIIIDKICDWRELIYQMAIDYKQSDSKILALNKEIALFNVNETNEAELQQKKEELQKWEATWNTNYVAYYTDLLGFWRLLYDPDNQDWNESKHWNPEYVEFIIDKETQQEQLHLKNHEGIIFWFDFIDDAYLEKYKPSNIGRRTKVINDNEVKGIFFEETPNLLFIKENELNQASQTLSYVRLNLTDSMTNYFRISTQGKSAKEVLDNLLYQHTYYCESITLNCVPIYYLQPNTRIEVYDEDSSINGEYIIKSYNIQLNHNGSMSITATRAEELIL